MLNKWESNSSHHKPKQSTMGLRNHLEYKVYETAI